MHDKFSGTGAEALVVLFHCIRVWPEGADKSCPVAEHPAAFSDLQKKVKKGVDKAARR